MFDIFWYSAYAFFLLGSTSFGYFILRFAFPEIRATSKEHKTGFSIILGTGVFVVSALVSLLLGQILLPVLMLVFTFVSIGLAYFKVIFFAPNVVRVAIPQARIAPAEAPKTPKEERLEEELEKIKAEEKHEELKEEKKPEGVKEEIKIEEKYAALLDVLKKKKIEKVEEKPLEVPKPVEEVRPRGRERYMRKREELKKESMLEEAKRSISYEEPSSLTVSDLPSVTLEDLGISFESEEMKTLEDLAGLVSEEKIEKEKTPRCPNCHAITSTIIYCPYCGKPFCSNCALTVKTRGNLIFYSCPHCKKEVIMKKE
ncbi:MAG: hypothetical protein QW735_00895 [archaeon]